MRFKLEFSIQGEKPFALPVGYHYELSSWIHKMLHFGNTDFTSWLQKKGYSDPNGAYRLYTFSDINFPGISHHQDRLIIEGDIADMIISFYAHGEIEPFIEKIFAGNFFKIGDNISKVAFKVERLEKLPVPDFDKGIAVFSCISPMLIAEPNTENYLNPEKNDFEKVFFKNLMFKYANLVKFMPGNSGAGLSNLKDLEFKLLSKAKSKIVKIRTDTPHQKSVKGYLFDFRVKAPEVLLGIGYHGGFGELNSLGFGCCRLKQN